MQDFFKDCFCNRETFFKFVRKNKCVKRIVYFLIFILAISAFSCGKSKEKVITIEKDLKIIPFGRFSRAFNDMNDRHLEAARRLGISPASSREEALSGNTHCLFIPETYQVYWDMSAEEFFERMQKEHQKFWNQERLDKATAIGMTPTEVCTLASIVEEETNNNPEKPMVAGLYINRLHTGMPLQADPTIKFALQDFGLRRITNAHLAVESPYNTYLNTGLPPGPIRIPSPIGLDAVLNHTKHNYLYMCAKEDFSGTHNFASNYAEHMKNARKYWNALNERKIFK